MWQLKNTNILSYLSMHLLLLGSKQRRQKATEESAFAHVIRGLLADYRCLEDPKEKYHGPVSRLSELPRPLSERRLQAEDKKYGTKWVRSLVHY